MIFFLFVLASVFFIAGGLIQLGSLSRYSTFVCTEGEIVAFIESIGNAGCTGENKQWFREPMSVAYHPVVVYRVGEKVYQVELSRTKGWKEADFSQALPLVYNPYEPAESYLKEGTPFLGLMLMMVSLLALILLLTL
ncbi:DUF3592 domain-containing protein [Nafulsella turpanensis]|uniref:DUF3592 domain-containing protein n=1 Tax=Nafulsella turpanensis TaxID=1265690 RepID=UPI00034DFC91|nr:DUF3592 domain-containing protein [Nafulsella turpanensis]